jgi:hypothetical protein
LFGLIGVLGLGLVLGVIVLATTNAKFNESQLNQARIDIRTIYPVAEKFVVDHPGRCPTVDRLRRERELSLASKTEDPWGMLYEIDCSDDRLVVFSRGPDRAAGTSDDVRTSSGDR